MLILVGSESTADTILQWLIPQDVEQFGNYERELGIVMEDAGLRYF